LVVPPGAAGFDLVPAAEVGIDFTNSLRFPRLAAAQTLMNGTGLAAGDVDGDGWVDLFFCHRDGPCALYRNLGGGRFTNITPSAGVALTHLTASGAVFGDVNGDGRLDLLVSSFGGPHALLVGDGTGRFRDVTAESGISSRTGATSMAMSDLDGDGDLDLYVCNFGTISPLRDGAELSERIVNGVPKVTGRWAKRVQIVDGRYVELGEPDMLFWNDGSGRFTAADWTKVFVDEEGRPLAETPLDLALAVQVRDVNGDGLPDIHVCNDFQTPDRLWIGDGRGRFRASPRFTQRTISYASMGVDFADVDRDGHLDFVTVEMMNRDPERQLRSPPVMAPRKRLPGLGLDREETPRNTLHRNRGDNTFEEIACMAGLAASDWSWTPLFMDVDLDGWEDLLVSNGLLHDVNDRDVEARLAAKGRTTSRGIRALLAEYPPIESPKCAFRNRRDLTFEEMGKAWGFHTTRAGYGMISADLDGDGDLDLVLNTLDGPPLVYRNRGGAARVAVRLRGKPGNAQSVGARLVLRGGPVVQSQEIVAGGQYLSGSDPLRVFAAGSGPMTLEVQWRDGSRSLIEGIRPNHLYEIDEAVVSKVRAMRGLTVEKATLFEDGSDRLGHVHVEPSFDDFGVHPLLPRKLSQLGPGVAVGDVDGDGREDLVVGSGRTGRVWVHRGNGEGGFRGAEALGSGPLPTDALGVLILPAGRSAATVLTSLVAFEQSNPGGPMVLAQRPGGALERWIPLGLSEGVADGDGGVAMAASDADGDGELDLFVGGARGGWVWKLGAGTPSRGVRVTTGASGIPGVMAATWADLDQDGYPELITAAEWGSVTVVDGRTGLPSVLKMPTITGWWRSVVAGDFDGDGRLDLAVGNWGRNSEWAVWAGNRPALLFGDLDGDGVSEWLEARVDSGGKWFPWRGRDAVVAAVPEFAGRVETHVDHARLDLRAWVGDRARGVHLDTLESVVLMNRGDRLEPRALPDAAQRSPVSGMVVADFDGDGREDLFLAQNCFAVRPEDSRQDAGRGLLLRGDGLGGFTAVPGHESGIRIHGEQRGAATGDFDRDGRPDLVVAQNGAATAFLLNRGARAGLRVAVVGPIGNPGGWGGTVRLKFGQRWGAARPLCGGGGYASQDSSIPVLATPERPTGIEVRWPGGRVTVAEVPAGAKEVRMGVDGIRQP